MNCLGYDIGETFAHYKLQYTVGPAILEKRAAINATSSLCDNYL